MADGGPQRILYVAPEVVHGPNQRLDSPKEWKTIEAEIRKSTRRDDLELLSPLTAAGLDDLIGRIIATRPHVLHITSHGEVGQLLLRDDLGRERPLSHDDLAKIITEHAPNLRLLVLNACFSAVDPDKLKAVVDYVIGMKERIAQTNACRFAGLLYASLGNGTSVEEACKAGANALKGGSPPQPLVPSLITRLAEGDPKRSASFLPPSGSFEVALPITPPEGLGPAKGYAYSVIQVCEGWYKPTPEQIRNEVVPFVESDGRLVATVRQTKAGLQFKCFVEIPADAPNEHELYAKFVEAGWTDFTRDRPDRVWFLLADKETAEESEAHIVNNYLRWSPA